MAVIVVVAIVAILIIYISGNLRTLHLLSRDLKQVEQKQLRRLAVANNSRTNSPGAMHLSWPTNRIAIEASAPILGSR